MLAGMASPPPQELLEHWRARGLLGVERLGFVLERAAALWPERVAVVDAQGRATFTQLRRRADAIAVALLDCGVGAGDVVSWTLPNRLDAIALVAATWRIGAVSNPIVGIYREHEFGFILDQLRPAAVVCPASFRDRRYPAELDVVLGGIAHRPRGLFVAGGTALGWTALDGLREPGAVPEGVEPALADDPCLVLYTSGTTSAPKGVVHSSAALAQEARSMQRAWALTWRDAMFMASPLTHVTGILQGLLVPSLVGARAVLAEAWDPVAAVEQIEVEGATYMAGATPFLQGIVEEYERRGGARPSLRQFCCGGAPVPSQLVERAHAVGIAAYRCWGLTEFPTATLACELDPLERRASTDGRRAEGVEVEAVDGERRPLPPGVEGELRVRGPERMIGYVDSSLDAEVLDGEGWLYTGDLGVVDRGGWVTVTGRLKDVINRGGEKFSAREIEDLLAAHPHVLEAAVLGVPGGRLGERVCAVVVPRKGVRVDGEELRRFLVQSRIARQKIPEEFREAGALPRSPAGKVQKFKLLEMF
jgi:acyl-CoA synthetase (AMP-forming)/AMP-acid ligase II